MSRSSTQVNLSLTPDEAAQLRAQAQAAGMPLNRFVVHLAGLHTPEGETPLTDRVRRTEGDVDIQRDVINDHESRLSAIETFLSARGYTPPR